MESEAHPVVFRDGVGILALEHPSTVGCAEFQLVAIELRTLGGEGRTDFRDLQVADAHELVAHLLTLGLQLHFVRQRLPAASAAHAEMPAERLEPVGGRLDHPGDEALHVVFLFLEDLDVHDVAGNGKIDKDHHSVHVREGLAFRGNGLDGHILQFQIDSFPAHAFQLYNIQR